MSETKFLVTLTHKKPLPEQVGSVLADRIYSYLYAQGVEAGVNVREMNPPNPGDEMRIRKEGDKEALKPVSKWEDECRQIVQKIARIRDRHDGCISCHMGPNYDGRWHGSHYRSVGACSNTQFLLWNIHKACEQCNFFKGGNREGYRPRLIEKIGLERVEWLDAQNQVTKRSGPAYIEYLKRFKAVMGKRLRRMERRLA
jgi:hypothetical protein